MSPTGASRVVCGETMGSSGLESPEQLALKLRAEIRMAIVDRVSAKTREEIHACGMPVSPQGRDEVTKAIFAIRRDMSEKWSLLDELSRLLKARFLP